MLDARALSLSLWRFLMAILSCTTVRLVWTQTDNRKCNPVWLLKHEDLGMMSLTAMIPPSPFVVLCVGLVHRAPCKIMSWLKPPSVEEEEMFLLVIRLFLLHVNWDEDWIPRCQSNFEHTSISCTCKNVLALTQCEKEPHPPRGPFFGVLSFVPIFIWEVTKTHKHRLYVL